MLIPKETFLPKVTLDLPTIFELVPLPERLDTLFELSRRKPCKNCGTVSVEPALCVFCGTFVCSQSYCCSKNGQGECTIHMKECLGNVAAYLLVNKSCIFVLHNQNGFFIGPPYLDAHGEVDWKLRYFFESLLLS